MDLPDPEPTPPGIPAEHINADEYHSLFEWEETDDDKDSK